MSIKTNVVDMTGKTVGSVDLSEKIFGAKVNAALLHSVVVAQLANRRQGTQSTLTRSEVSGGGKKPWRQKGTGRARQGSTRSPQWTHGGVSLGPKPRTYKVNLNKKARRAALYSALSDKMQNGNIIVVDNIAALEYKTKTMVKFLDAVKADGKSLVILNEIDSIVIGSFSNIPTVKTAQADSINVYDILNAEKFVVSTAALAKIEEVFA